MSSGKGGKPPKGKADKSGKAPKGGAPKAKYVVVEKGARLTGKERTYDAAIADHLRETQQESVPEKEWEVRRVDDVPADAVPSFLEDVGEGVAAPFKDAGKAIGELMAEKSGKKKPSKSSKAAPKTEETPPASDAAQKLGAQVRELIAAGKTQEAWDAHFEMSQAIPATDKGGRKLVHDLGNGVQGAVFKAYEDGIPLTNPETRAAGQASQKVPGPLAELQGRRETLQPDDELRSLRTDPTGFVRIGKDYGAPLGHWEKQALLKGGNLNVVDERFLLPAPTPGTRGDATEGFKASAPPTKGGGLSVLERELGSVTKKWDAEEVIPKADLRDAAGTVLPVAAGKSSGFSPAADPMEQYLNPLKEMTLGRPGTESLPAAEGRSAGTARSKGNALAELDDELAVFPGRRGTGQGKTAAALGGAAMLGGAGVVAGTELADDRPSELKGLVGLNPAALDGAQDSQAAWKPYLGRPLLPKEQDGLPSLPDGAVATNQSDGPPKTGGTGGPQDGGGGKAGAGAQEQSDEQKKAAQPALPRSFVPDQERAYKNYQGQMDEANRVLGQLTGESREALEGDLARIRRLEDVIAASDREDRKALAWQRVADTIGRALGNLGAAYTAGKAGVGVSPLDVKPIDQSMDYEDLRERSKAAYRRTGDERSGAERMDRNRREDATTRYQQGTRTAGDSYAAELRAVGQSEQEAREAYNARLRADEVARREKDSTDSKTEKQKLEEAEEQWKAKGRSLSAMITQREQDVNALADKTKLPKAVIEERDRLKKTLNEDKSWFDGVSDDEALAALVEQRKAEVATLKTQLDEHIEGGYSAYLNKTPTKGGASDAATTSTKQSAAKDSDVVWLSYQGGPRTKVSKEKAAHYLSQPGYTKVPAP